MLLKVSILRVTWIISLESQPISGCNFRVTENQCSRLFAASVLTGDKIWIFDEKKTICTLFLSHIIPSLRTLFVEFWRLSLTDGRIWLVISASFLKSFKLARENHEDDIRPSTNVIITGLRSGHLGKLKTYAWNVDSG